MPVFEYRCHACGRRFPWLEGVIEDGAECVCPHCGGREVSRLISRFAVNRSEDEDLEFGDENSGDNADEEGGLDDEFADEEDEE